MSKGRRLVFTFLAALAAALVSPYASRGQDGETVIVGDIADAPTPDDPAPSITGDAGGSKVGKAAGRKAGEAVPADPEPEGIEPKPLEPKVTSTVRDPKRDENVERVQAPLGGETNPLPPAAAGATAPGGNAAMPFVVEPTRIPTPGAQSIGLTVQVFAPASMNIRKQATVTIVVRNAGPNDAQHVVVRDQLPDGLKYLGAVPDPGANSGATIAWNLDVLPAGTEKRIKLNVEPQRVGSFEHVATVTALAASKASTEVREPKLKIEQTVNKTKTLRGTQVKYNITVSNTGTGPAKDVVVRAELSSGLKHVEGNIIELPLSDANVGRPVLEPGTSVTLPELVVDTVAGGEQRCVVEAISPDVAGDLAEARRETTILVTEPRLKFALEGSKTRPTDTIGSYTVTVENPGTAPAQNVQISATLQGDGMVQSAPGATWNKSAHKLTWTIPSLEPDGKPQRYTFQIRLGGVQQYVINAQARANGGLNEGATWTTQVVGTPDVEVEVSERLRIIDVGQSTYFKIRIRNNGSLDATKLQLSAKLSEHLKADGTRGTDKQANLDTTENRVVFPTIERLAPGAEKLLYVNVKGDKPGTATCRVYLTHQEMGNNEKLEDMATTKITERVGAQ